MFEWFSMYVGVLSDIPLIGPAYDSLQEAFPIGRYIENTYDFIDTELSYIEQLVFVAIFAVIFILGLISFVKKLAKLLIVVAIIFGIWLLYNQGVIG